MKRFLIKIICLLFCVPFYPLHMFAICYEKKGYGVAGFSFIDETVEYWIDVYTVLRY